MQSPKKITLTGWWDLVETIYDQDWFTRRSDVAVEFAESNSPEIDEIVSISAGEFITFTTPVSFFVRGASWWVVSIWPFDAVGWIWDGWSSGAYVRNWYSSRFSETVNVATVESALDQIFEFSSQPPTINISFSPSAILREFWNNVVNPDITANATLWQNPSWTLTKIERFRGTAWWTLINTENTPTPSTSYLFKDTLTISANQQYTVKITDDQARINTNSWTFTFTYPFYTGIVSSWDLFSWITRAQILALWNTNVVVKNKSTTAVTTSPTNQRFMIGYPASYWSLISIIDANWFETISDYDIFDYDVVWLDGTTQAYRFYVLKSNTTQTSFLNTYYF